MAVRLVQRARARLQGRWCPNCDRRTRFRKAMSCDVCGDKLLERTRDTVRFGHP
jgi:hypothetical protein